MMTINDLLTECVSVAREVASGITLPHPAGDRRNPVVHPYWCPLLPGSQKPEAPMIVVSPIKGEDGEEGSTCQIRFDVATWSRDTSGMADLKRLIDRLRSRLLVARFIGGFPLVLPMEWEREAEDQQPYYMGSLNATFNLASYIRDGFGNVEFDHQPPDLITAVSWAVDRIVSGKVMDDPRGGHHAALVHPYDMPPKLAGQSVVPQIVVSPESGEDAEDRSTETLNIEICTYSKELNGWIDLLSVIERIRGGLASHPLVDGRYSLESPLTWETSYIDEYPYWKATVTTAWSYQRSTYAPQIIYPSDVEWVDADGNPVAWEDDNGNPVSWITVRK
jgi:hypothetical protein